ncbi:MAG: hypothetical protein QW814_02800 [Methanothrix sp.]
MKESNENVAAKEETTAQTQQASTTATQAHSPKVADNGQGARKSLSLLIKESNNPEVLSIKNQIDECRKERDTLITEIKDYRRKLEYKEAENIAITKFVESEKDNVEVKKIGYLKRQKNRLEFKLSTEARMSLDDEKGIIRKIAEIDGQLEGLLKFVRLQRKIGYIQDDIKNYTEKLNETDRKIRELDTKLDDLYLAVRKALGIHGGRGMEQQRPVRKKQTQQMQQPEINMEDIAVIKKKGKAE